MCMVWLWMAGKQPDGRQATGLGKLVQRNDRWGLITTIYNPSNGKKKQLTLLIAHLLQFDVDNFGVAVFSYFLNCQNEWFQPRHAHFVAFWDNKIPETTLWFQQD